MRFTYDEEGKILIVIAQNLAEQKEISGLAAILRHGDLINLGYNSQEKKIHLGGAIERRWGKELEFQVDSNGAYIVQWVLAVIFSEFRHRTLVYAWPAGDPGGYDSLVFFHD